MSQETVRFECPVCHVTHRRGFVDGVSVFRCLSCGYQGHGFHPDAAIDEDVYQQHCESNAWNRSRGIPEVPLGVDPLGHGA